MSKKSDPSSPDDEKPEAPLALTGPAAEQRECGGDTTEPRRKSPPLKSRDEILRAVQQLPALVALGIISTAKSTAILRAYQTLLAQYDKSSQGGKGQLADADMLHVFRERPDLQKLLEPILTDEQIALLVKDVTDDRQSEA